MTIIGVNISESSCVCHHEPLICPEHCGHPPPRDFHKFMPTQSMSGQGVGLSRRAWTRVNRLRTGVGRFGANMLRWGLSTNDSCDCGAEQTADHITSGCCPIYRPPEGINSLIVLDDETRAWLENQRMKKRDKPDKESGKSTPAH